MPSSRTSARHPARPGTTREVRHRRSTVAALAAATVVALGLGAGVPAAATARGPAPGTPGAATTTTVATSADRAAAADRPRTADRPAPADGPLTTATAAAGVAPAADPLAAVRAPDGSVDWWVGLTEQQRAAVHDPALVTDPPEPSPEEEVVTDRGLGRVGQGVEVDGVLGWGMAWLGAVTEFAEAGADEWLSWCVTSGYAAPGGETGVPTGTLDDPVLAEVLRKHEAEDTPLTRAAVSFLAHTRHETGTDAVPAAVRVARFIARTPQHVQDHAAALLASGAATAGPYGAREPAAVEGGSTRGGFLRIHPLVGSARGQSLVGHPMEVRFTGPAVFDVAPPNGVADPGETAVHTGTTPASTLSLPWVSTGTGEVTWEYTYGDVPRETVTVMTPDGQVQRVLTYGVRAASDLLEVTTPGPTFPVVTDFAVTLSSDVPAAHVAPGEPVEDVVHVAVPPGDTWAEVDGTAVTLHGEDVFYGPYDTPPPPSPEVPPDAPVAARVPFTVAGAGDVAVTAPADLPGGFYVAVPSVTRAMQPEETRGYLRADATHDFGLPAQTAAVPFQPVGVSQVAEQVVGTGEAYVDRLRVSAAEGHRWLQERPGDPVDVLLEGTACGVGTAPPPEPAPGVVGRPCPDGEAELGTARILADGPGDYAAELPGVGAGGIVTVVWQVVRDHQPAPEWIAGDWSDQHGLAAETLSVRHDTGRLDSDLRAHATQSGRYLVDDLWVSGLPDDYPTFPGGDGLGPDTPELVHELWFFPAGLEIVDANLDQAESLGTVTTPARNGYHPSIGSEAWRVRVDDAGREVPGTYAVVSSHAASDRVEGWTSSATDPHEQLTVRPEPLTVTTKAAARGPDGRPVAAPTAGDRGAGVDTHVLHGTVQPGDRGRSIAYLDTDRDGSWAPDEQVWTSDWVAYEPGPADGREVAVPGEVPYGAYPLTFAQETVDATGVRIAYEPPGSPDQTLDVAAVEAPAGLAVTGADAAALGGGAAALLAGGLGAALWRRRLTRSLDDQGDPVVGASPLR